MKTKLIFVLALVALLALSMSASQTTVTGILTDDMCTRKHMMPGKPNADCVRECIKHGAKYVVIEDGKVLELAGNQEQIGALAGKIVKLAGQNKGKVFVVSAVQAAQ